MSLEKCLGVSVPFEWQEQKITPIQQITPDFSFFTSSVLPDGDCPPRQAEALDTLTDNWPKS